MRILLVEDNPDHTALIERCLAESHAEVELSAVRDGEEALSYLRHQDNWADPARSPRPHMILLDLRLPRLDGFDVLKAIKDSPELQPIPVVILTTSDAGPDVARAQALHASSYLVKPVDFHRFAKVMSDVEEYWLEWNRQAAPAAP